jgi:signal transduction histidine kinase
MSLRGRLLILIVLMNLLVLGVIHATAVVLQNQFLERETRTHLQILQRDYGYLLPAGTRLGARATNAVRQIFERGNFRDKFSDILISKGVEKSVDLNPLGCAHRDHATFPHRAILDGIRRAMAERRLVSVAGGRCVAIENQEGVVEGGAWFVPAFPPEPHLTFQDYAIPVLLSMLVFAVLASWVVGRTLGRPMDKLGAAVRQLEEGDYSARVPTFSSRELNRVMDAFNAMASKVEGHTAELEHEVERAMREAAAKERALVVSARLASMGTLAAGIAHEINNPIGGMLNAVNTLAQAEGRSEKERRYLALIQQGLERVARTSRKLLDFTPRILEPVQYSIADSVEGARALVEHRLGRQGVALEVDIPADIPVMMGEPHEIQQVILNLLLNSLNAMRDLPDRHIEVRVQRLPDGTGVELAVRDDGPGVDAAALPQVMDPFFSGSQAPDATGLGLFICYTIIQNHGGTMRVESKFGEGFVVRMTLPTPR